MSENTPRVLAVASTGGHWQQLMQIMEAFEDADVTYACTDPAQGEVYCLPSEIVGLRDYSRSHPISVLRGMFETFSLVWRVKPDVVISTGAAPGLLALLWGRLTGARCIWVDSIANSQRLSLSGRLAKNFCSRTITQWEHLADGRKVIYWGSVL